LDTSAFVVIFLALALGSFAKAITGLGLPLIAIPIISVWLSVETAVVILALPTAVTNLWVIWSLREGRHDFRGLWPLYVTSGVGAVVGTYVLTSISDRAITLCVAMIVFGFIALRLLQPDFQLDRGLFRRIAAPVGALIGVVHGATGISGPLVTTYVAAARAPRVPHVFLVSSVFQVVTTVQLTTMIALGLFDRDRTIGTLLALIPVALVTPLGLRFGRRVRPETFQRLLLGLLAAVGLRLVYRVFTG
jgi:uncharacterized membrane protein YfcA